MSVVAKIRAKRPTGKPLANAVEALEAFRRMQEYKSMSDAALGMYHTYSPGTATAEHHYSRYIQYAEIADEWKDLFVSWLKSEAEKSKGKMK